MVAGALFQRLWLAAAREWPSIHPLVGMVLFEMRRRGGGGRRRFLQRKSWLEAARDLIVRWVPDFRVAGSLGGVSHRSRARRHRDSRTVGRWKKCTVLGSWTSAPWAKGAKRNDLANL